MITHTNAFSVYRNLGQAHLNFVVLTCHAVPALRKEISVSGKLPSVAPDYFKSGNNPPAEIMGYMSDYKDELARSALITIFSYFEAYVKDALREIVDFHGGELSLRRMARERAQKFLASTPPTINDSRRKLQDRPDPKKRGKYEKHARLLDKAGYRFPTDLFAPFGALQLLTKIGKKQSFKAHEIPELLENALLFPLSETDRNLFEKIRLARNGIAHGKGALLTLPTALRYSSELHRVAAAVDSHIAKHFLVIQAI